MRYTNSNRDLLDGLIKEYAHGHALDVGGGYGRYSDMIRKHLKSVKVVDIHPQADIHGDVTNMTMVEDESYDTVISVQTLEHVEYPERMMAEMYRVLKRGGICILTVPFVVTEHKDPTDFQRYTFDGINSLFKRTGFSIVASEKYGGVVGVARALVRFYFDYPYTRHERGRVKRKIMYYVVKFFDFLETSRFAKWVEEPEERFYNGTYVVARK